MKVKSRFFHWLILPLFAVSIVGVLPGQTREPVDFTPLISAGSVNALPGGLAEIPIYVRNLAGQNATALQVDIYFDVRWAEVLEVKAGEASIRSNKQVVSNRMPSEFRALATKPAAADASSLQRLGSGKTGREEPPAESKPLRQVVPAMRQRIIVAGMDNTPLNDGVVAFLILRLREAVPEGQFEIGLDRPVVSSADAKSLPLRQQTGWVSSSVSRLRK